MRSVFCLAVVLLVVCAMEVTIAAGLSNPSRSLASTEKISGIWAFDDRPEEKRSMLLYTSPPNSMTDKFTFLDFDCSKMGDDRGTIYSSVPLPAGDWKEGQIVTINISSGSKSLKLRSDDLRWFTPESRWFLNGGVRRIDRPAFYDLFNASDTLTVEVNGRKVQFDLRGSQQAVSQLQQACPAVLPPCCTEENHPRYATEYVKAVGGKPVKDNSQGHWRMDWEGTTSSTYLNYQFNDLSFQSSSPLTIRCNSQLVLLVESRDDGWGDDQPVTIKISSNGKPYSVKATMHFYSSEGGGGDYWTASGTIKNRSAFYGLFGSAGTLAVDVGGTDKMLLDLRDSGEGIEKLKEACPVGGK